MHCMNCGQKITSEEIEVCVMCGRRTGHITPKTMRQKVVSQERAIQQEKERIQSEMVERLTDTAGDWEKKMEYIYEPMDALDGIISDYTKKITTDYPEYSPVYRVDDGLLESLTKNSNNEILPSNEKLQIQNINNKEIINQTPPPPPPSPPKPTPKPTPNYVQNEYDDDDIPSTIIVKNEDCLPPPPVRRQVNDKPHVYVISGEDDGNNTNDVSDVSDGKVVSQQLEELRSAKEVIQEKVQEIQAAKEALAKEEEKASRHIEDDVKEYVPSKSNIKNDFDQWQSPYVQGQPAYMQGQQPQTQEQRPQMQGQPSQMQGQAPQMQGQPPQMQGQPPQMQGQPPQMQGQPPQMQGQPPQMQGQPPQMQRQAPQMQGQPPQMQGQPPQMQGQPPQMQGQPSQMNMQTTIPSQYYNNPNNSINSNVNIQPQQPSQFPQPKNNTNNNIPPKQQQSPPPPQQQQFTQTNDYYNQNTNPNIIDETHNTSEKSESSIKVFFLSFLSFTTLLAVCCGIYMLIPRDFKIEDGILVEYTGRDTVVQIPNKVDKIADGVFQNLSFIEEIIIPETVTSIGNSAFANCTSLTNVQFHDNIVYFGDNVLDGVPLFSGYTFQGSTLVEYSGNETNIVIPDFVTVIGKQAFFNNDTMEKITLPSGLRTIEEVAFSSCDTIDTIVIPNGTTTIENSAFSGCDNLSNVIIPSSVNFIGSDAFSGTVWYNSLSEEFNIFGNNILIKYVGRSADVIIPDNVTLIGNAAFRNNENIKSVTIPSKVNEIGYQAFSGCSALATVIMNEGVTTISEGAFLGCFSLKTIEFPTTIMSIKYMSLRSTTWYQNFYDKFAIVGGSTLIRYFGDESFIEIPAEVKHITDEAFSGTPFVEAIILNSTVVYIDDRAFNELPNLEKIYCIEGSYVDDYFKENDELAHISVIYG